MTEKEKIREFLVGMADSACCDYATERDIRNIILPYIDSLKEDPKHSSLERIEKNWKEEPISEGLEKEIKSFAYQIQEECKESTWQFDWDDMYQLLCDTARHFANWQKHKDNEEESDMLLIASLDSAERGKKVMYEQMMKKAVNGYIIGNSHFKDKNINLCGLSDEEYNRIGDFGDNVKVIVIKNEQ